MHSTINSTETSSTCSQIDKTIFHFITASPRNNHDFLITKKITPPQSAQRNDKTFRESYIKRTSNFFSTDASSLEYMLNKTDDSRGFNFSKNIFILPQGQKSIRFNHEPKFQGQTNFRRRSKRSFFMMILLFLINWEVIKKESKRKTPVTWALILLITLLFILKCFTSQFRPIFTSTESFYNETNQPNPYEEVQLNCIKIFPSWYLSITTIDMVQTFALYYPLIKKTKYVVEVFDHTKNREKGSQCCDDLYNTISYQTIIGVKCLGRESKHLIKNRYLFDGNICGIDPLYCHQNNKDDYSLPRSVINYPIDITCDYSSTSGGMVHDHEMKVPYKPCTFGIHGRCELMSEDKCAWIGGYYHWEAHLCSQVDGIQDLIFLGSDWHVFWMVNSKILSFLEKYLSLFTRIVISFVSVESFLSLLVVIFMVLHGILILERQHSIEVVLTLYIFYAKVAGLTSLYIQPNIPHYTCFNVTLALFSLSNIYPKILSGSNTIFKNRLYYVFLLIFTFFINPSTPIITPWANIALGIITFIQRKYVSYPGKNISFRTQNIIMITSLIFFLLPLEWIIKPLSSDIVQDIYCDFFPKTEDCIYYNNLRAVNFDFFKKLSVL
uniref:Uncharacterized protein n=1 Tax=Strongyloides venezuelensis TaxID=75913 RepID=A0A0K0EZR8_STRVS